MALVAVGGDLSYFHGLKARFPERVEILEAADKDEAARIGVGLVHDGRADVVMKGNINTDNLLRAVLDKEHGLLPKGRVMSHVTAVEVPDYGRLILFSDAAVIPAPTLEQFDAMIRYDIDVCRRLGLDEPKVALIHFTEKVNPKFPYTLDYVTLMERAGEGGYGAMQLGGPMDVKTACCAESGEIKGISSPVVGTADVLIFPDLQPATHSIRRCRCSVRQEWPVWLPERRLRSWCRRVPIRRSQNSTALRWHVWLAHNR